MNRAYLARYGCLEFSGIGLITRRFQYDHPLRDAATEFTSVRQFREQWELDNIVQHELGHLSEVLRSCGGRLSALSQQGCFFDTRRFLGAVADRLYDVHECLDWTLNPTSPFSVENPRAAYIDIDNPARDLYALAEEARLGPHRYSCNARVPLSTDGFCTVIAAPSQALTDASAVEVKEEPIDSEEPIGPVGLIRQDIPGLPQPTVVPTVEAHAAPELPEPAAAPAAEVPAEEEPAGLTGPEPPAFSLLNVAIRPPSYSIERTRDSVERNSDSEPEDEDKSATEDSVSSDSDPRVYVGSEGYPDGPRYLPTYCSEDAGQASNKRKSEGDAAAEDDAFSAALNAFCLPLTAVINNDSDGNDLSFLTLLPSTLSGKWAKAWASKQTSAICPDCYALKRRKTEE